MELVESEKLFWAWDEVLPMGVVTLLGGRAGIGKSTFLAWLTAEVTNGTLEGDLYGSPARVTFVAGEDDLGRVLGPRLRAAGANLKLVTSLSVEQHEDDGSSWVSMPSVKNDLSDLKQALYENGTTLLIIDPLSATMEGDTNSEQVVRSQLGRLAHLAGEMNIAVLAVKHWHKGAGESIDRISGSHGFTDIVRSVIQLIQDEENDQLVLTSDKNNYGQRKPSFGFRLKTVEVHTKDGGINQVGKALFLGETEVRVEDILRREAEQNLGDVNQKILEHLRTAGASTPEQISSAIGIQNPTVRKYLQRLEKNGFVSKPHRGVYEAGSPVAPVPSVSSVPKETQVTLGTPLEVA
jgi:RecA-family ATPase